MKLSIITTITDPYQRQDPYLEAFANYKDLADEVIIIDGGDQKRSGQVDVLSEKMKVVYSYWPKDWSWDELPKHLNAGLEHATGDWVIKLDIDQFIHEREFGKVREALGNINSPVATFQKFSVYPKRRFMQKGEIVTAINKAVSTNKIKYGLALGQYTDLCVPIWQTGIDKFGVPTGKLVDKYHEAGRTGITFWNFDYTFKTMEVAKQEFYRFSMAHKKYFGQTSWGNTLDESWEVFLRHMKSRLAESIYQIEDLSVLPKYIKDKYRNLQPKQFGFNGWGLL